MKQNALASDEVDHFIFATLFLTCKNYQVIKELTSNHV